MAGIQEVYDLVVKGKSKLIGAAVQEALDAGCDAAEILNKGMISAMDEVGEKFKNGEIFVPEMLVAARAMKKGVEVLKPHLASGVAGAAGKVVIGTVAGDLHDIGKNLVAMMLESSGFEVIDLGVNCDVTKYEQAVRDGAQIVACSSLLTTTMPYMKEVVAYFKDKGVKVIIGGAPVTQAYADEIGADGYSEDANGAVKLVDSLLKRAC